MDLFLEHLWKEQSGLSEDTYLIPQAQFECGGLYLEEHFLYYALKKCTTTFDSYLPKKHILSKPQHFSVNTAFHDSIIYHWQGLRNNDTFTSL